MLDLPGLQDLLRKLHSRELCVVEVETPTASPFASSLLFDYVATYMYEGDTPNAERRAAALSLDRDLLRELLGQEELRDLIDPGALEQVEADLQRMSERTRADSADALHDVLRRLGDLTTAEARERCAGRRPRSRGSSSSRASAARCASGVGGEERWIAAEDAGLYRDAFGVVPPAGLPAAFLEDVPDARERLVRRYARTHGPFESGDAARALRRRLHAVLEALERVGRPRPRRAAPRRHARASGATPRCCAGCAAPRSPRCARRSSRPTSARSAASTRAGRASTATRPPAPASTACARCSSRCRGCALPADVWERDVLPRRVGAYSPAWLDQLCASGEVVWVGAGSLGRSSGRVALLLPRGRRAARPAAAAAGATRPRRRPRARSASGCAAAPASSPTCWSTSPGIPPRRSRRRCGTSCGRAR